MKALGTELQHKLMKNYKEVKTKRQKQSTRSGEYGLDG
jgi:hypothetical protein